MVRRLQARVSGHVQGVGFRGFVALRAQRLRLRGYVRNLMGGEVEVVAEGEEHDLRNLLQVLEAGPRAARVTNVQVSWAEPTGEFASFTVRGTSY
ncbi:MAG: acylphosphatase [Armatimonadetes bacterium]|nr:acylphosphatase [Armatimonadota bacterium]